MKMKVVQKITCATLPLMLFVYSTIALTFGLYGRSHFEREIREEFESGKIFIARVFGDERDEWLYWITTDFFTPFVGIVVASLIFFFSETKALKILCILAIGLACCLIVGIFSFFGDISTVLE